MPDSMADVLCVIPAKAQSERIPNKNFRPLAGLTPTERAIEVAHRACPDAQIVLSTDAASWMTPSWVTVVRQIPRMSMVDVLSDVLKAIPGEPGQIVLLVQPTQPLRRPESLQRAVAIMTKLGVDSVASVTPVVSIDKLYDLSNAMTLQPCGRAVERDQDARATYRCDGTVYGCRRRWFQAYHTFRHARETYPMMIKPDETCALDTPYDWYLAELILRDRQHIPSSS